MKQYARQLRRAIADRVYDFECRSPEKLKCSWAYEPNAGMLETSHVDGATDEYVYHWTNGPTAGEVADNLDLWETCDDLEVYQRSDVEHVKCSYGEFDGDNEELVDTSRQVTEQVLKNVPFH